MVLVPGITAVETNSAAGKLAPVVLKLGARTEVVWEGTVVVVEELIV